MGHLENKSLIFEFERGQSQKNKKLWA